MCSARMYARHSSMNRKVKIRSKGALEIPK